MSLKAAAQRVIDSWESGDLAAAVRDLQDALEEDTISAAAPELLDALKRLTDQVAEANAFQHSGLGVSDKQWSSLYQLQHEARAAIAKAEGR